MLRVYPCLAPNGVSIQRWRVRPAPRISSTGTAHSGVDAIVQRLRAIRSSARGTANRRSPARRSSGGQFSGPVPGAISLPCRVVIQGGGAATADQHSDGRVLWRQGHPTGRPRTPQATRCGWPLAWSGVPPLALPAVAAGSQRQFPDPGAWQEKAADGSSCLLDQEQQETKARHDGHRQAETPATRSGPCSPEAELARPHRKIRLKLIINP